VEDADWKLKIKFGKLVTPFKHITVLADGIVGELSDGFHCEPGRAWMSMKTWSTDYDEAADMIKVIGRDIGFEVDGKVEMYDTDAEQPPRDSPYGYDISFAPYSEESN